MEHDVSDDLERRLHAARPDAARVRDPAFDEELLARVREQPIARRRAVPRAVALPVAAGVTLAVTAVVTLGGGPGKVGGPSSASAITQALRWLNPPPGSVLHVRSVETSGERTTTRELWQSADDPNAQRELTEGERTLETAGDAFYDPATDTIYDPPRDRAKPALDAPKNPSKAGEARKAADPSMPAGDPIVAKVRMLLQDGAMAVTGREVRNGSDAWVISLKPDAGRPVWTLWVSAADGKPLELRDPGRDASERPQVIRWPTYEVLDDGSATKLLSLTGAHPTASVVRDPAQVAAARQRLQPKQR